MPRSSKQITEDNDYILFRVILFRRVADTFKAACRQAGYQVDWLCRVATVLCAWAGSLP